MIHDTHSYGALSMQQVYAKSSNIGAIQIGLKVGDRGLYKYVRKFGFGRKTGIELPGESLGNGAARGGLDADLDRLGGDGP